MTSHFACERPWLSIGDWAATTRVSHRWKALATCCASRESFEIISTCLESLLKTVTFKAHDQPALLRFLYTVPNALRAAIKNIHCTYEIYCPPWNARIDIMERPWIYYQGRSEGWHFEQHQLQNNRNVAVWELEKLERFRLELAAEGIVLKVGVLKADVRVDGVHLDWMWKL